MAFLSSPQVIPENLFLVFKISFPLPVKGASTWYTTSLKSTSFSGSPSSKASTQYKVAGWSFRQLKFRLPVRVAINPFGRTSSKGTSFMTVTTFPFSS